MSSILTPGYLRWDGTKYVLDQDVEIVGPTGSAGPAGPTGATGPVGPGGGATASGDISGTYPGPMSVISLTGTAGILPFAFATVNPTITQAGTAAVTGQSLTINAQDGAITGGNVILQGGTGTTAGLIQFLNGNTLAGYFDANGILRVGANSNSTASVYGGTAPLVGNDVLFGYDAGASQSTIRLVSGATTNQAVVEAINASAGGSLSVALRILASGGSDAITDFAGNGIIEQIGISTSALVFSKALGDQSSRGTTGRIFQTGAWGIGDTTTNLTSSAAQAGLTGSLINISSVTGGALTTAANQTTIFNTTGTINLQGNTGVNLLTGTTLIASTVTNRFVTNLGRRIRVVPITTSPFVVPDGYDVVSVGTFASPFTVTLPTSPTIGDILTVKDANGSATANAITVGGNGNNIDGSTSATISTNYGTITVVYNGAHWISI